MPLPSEFDALLDQVVPPAQLDRARSSFALEKPTAFWVNPLRAGTEATLEELRDLMPEPVPWLDGAFTVGPSQRHRLTHSDAFAAGRVYVQGLASLLAPLVLDPQPGEEILDLAAAPGGKTLRIAAMMKNCGRIAAVEPVKTRFFKLRANLKRGGVTIAHTYRADGRSIGAKTPERFDRVLLDAPCSSEARFSLLQPESFAHWTSRKVKESAHKQRGLIESAFAALKSGGILVYCTCSLSPEENELVVDTFLRRHADAASIEPLALPIDNTTPGLTTWGGETLDPRLSHAVRVLPTETMDAFFLCRIRKRRR